MTVEITEVLRRSFQGVTQPFICRGDDGDIYFVKGVGAGRRSQICEWIAGRLGQELGLPIAPFEIVEIPAELLEFHNGVDLSDLGVGPAFGSRRHRVTELSYAAVHDVPLALQMQVLAFDWWVRNGDRMLTEEGGNPNLFWDPGEEKLIVLDHNQAFDPTFSEEDFLQYHAFNGVASRLFRDLKLRNTYSGNFADALNMWQEICDTIPEVWWFADREMTVPTDFDRAAARTMLERCQTPEFWNSP